MSVTSFEFLRGLESAPWLAHYPQGVSAHLYYPHEPIWWVLDEAARRHPDRVACLYYEEELTYRQLVDLARRGAAVLSRLGLKPGDRVGVLLPNCPEHLTAVYAIWMAGGVVVSLSPLMVPEEVSELLAVTDCRMVVALDLLTPLVLGGSKALEQLLWVTLQDRLPRLERFGYSVVRLMRNGFRTGSGSVTLRSFSREIDVSAPIGEPMKRPCESPAYILPTGGTTGNPKAVVLTHRNLVANAWQLRRWAGNRDGEESVLAVLPFFHSYGLSTCVTSGIAMAASLILHHRFRPDTALRLIEEHRATIFYAVPVMLSALNARLRQRPADLSSLKWCISGGASLDPAVAREFGEHSGATVVEGYGLSEASPVTHVGPLDGTTPPGSIGFPLPDTEARIVEPQTGRKAVETGEIGELVVRGPQVMAGYWINPRETARVLRDGWLYTGDLATCDEHGFFRIVDRKKDLIITSGFNVYPTDVEHVLRQCPGVADVAVVGMPDARRGEVVKAVIVPERGRRFDRKAFHRFAHKHLAKHKRPRIVEVLKAELPRNFLGKVLRRKLRVRAEGVPAAVETAAGTVSISE